MKIARTGLGLLAVSAILFTGCRDRETHVAQGSPTPWMGTPETATPRLQPNAPGPGGLGNKASDGDGGVP